MERRALGSSGVQVPVVGMGTWSTLDVRGDAQVADRRAVVDAALVAGSDLFDTSPMYGRSPQVLASALEGRRKHAIIADKVWTASRAAAKQQIERSLRLFGGAVDIFQVHNLVAWSERLSMLEEVRDRGATRIIGATHYAHHAFGELMTIMRTGRIQCIQVPYNALDSRVTHHVLPLAAELGLGVLVMQPFDTGRLVRRTPRADALRPLAAYGIHSWSQALLKWILSDRRVHCVLPATSHAERATENAAAGDPPWLDDDARAYIVRLAGGND